MKKKIIAALLCALMIFDSASAVQVSAAGKLAAISPDNAAGETGSRTS